MDNILFVIEDIKQNITDNQNKAIMDNLMIIHNDKEKNIITQTPKIRGKMISPEQAKLLKDVRIKVAEIKAYY